MKRIYLDHAATTPIAEESLAALEPYLTSNFGNAGSLHQEGRAAQNAIDGARDQISAYVGCEFGECLFTSTGTESANLALLGVASATKTPRRRILVSAIEHHCVLNQKNGILNRLGFRVEVVPVRPSGQVDLSALRDSLDDDVLLVAVMHANNETGVIQPILEAAKLTKAKGALFFLDSVQTFRSELSVKNLWADGEIDLLTASAHKVGGPKGAALLAVRAGTSIQPILNGGEQEREMRPGTENVAAIVGFAAAMSRPTPEFEKRSALRDQFRAELVRLGAIPNVPKGTAILSGHLNIRFPNVSAESMLIRLDRSGIAASAGAACSAGSIDPSHVLLAMGLSTKEANESIRFTLGESTTHEDIQEATRRISTIIESLR